MNLLFCVNGIVFSLVVMSHAVGNEPCSKEKAADQIIPFEKIRFGGPGSRRFRDLEPELFVRRDTPEKIAKYSTPEGLEEFKQLIEKAKKESRVLAIERAMHAMPKGKDGKVGAGFAVEGQGRAALQGIYDVLAAGKEPQQRFNAGKELSLVFYNRPMQAGIRLESVRRSDEVFNIEYLLVSHGMQVVSPNVGLIQIGKLQPGDYRVHLLRCREKEAEFNEQGFPPSRSAWKITTSANHSVSL